MIKIKTEEFETNRETIAKAESLWNKNFPKDYVEFLLNNNGGIVYPNHPNLGPENKTEIWAIERFLSIGDIIIQKEHQMTYGLNDVYEEDLDEFNLSINDIVVFAKGDRGVYFFNLDEDEFGHIYIANFSGGDGITKTCATTFRQFINSLGMAEWDDQEFNPNFTFSNKFHSGIKAMQSYMFNTPENPNLGFQRFKEVFDYYDKNTSTEDGYKGIAYKYVDDRLKLNYLLEKGCDTNNLLRGAKKAETIEYLVKELKLDINRMDNDRYPLQNYLIDRPDCYAKQNYELIDELLKRDIPLDWSINAKTYDGKDEPPMVEKLLTLHKKYKEMIVKEEEFQTKYQPPSGISSFIKSKLIEKKLGISDNRNWLSKLFNKKENER